MKNTSYDIFTLASLQRWQKGGTDDNLLQMERLRHNLSLALEHELTPRQRETVELYYYQHLTVSAIAAEMGLSRSSVSRTLKRARARLHRVLQYSF